MKLENLRQTTDGSWLRQKGKYLVYKKEDAIDDCLAELKEKMTCEQVSGVEIFEFCIEMLRVFYPGSVEVVDSTVTLNQRPSDN